MPCWIPLASRSWPGSGPRSRIAGAVFEPEAFSAPCAGRLPSSASREGGRMAPMDTLLIVVGVLLIAVIGCALLDPWPFTVSGARARSMNTLAAAISSATLQRDYLRQGQAPYRRGAGSGTSVGRHRWPHNSAGTLSTTSQSQCSCHRECWRAPKRADDARSYNQP
jgi:hypothetical protein